MHPITLVVTSCNRHDLLEKTLRSFCQHNTHQITETIVIEDGPTAQPAFLKSLNLGKITWLNNSERKGQIYSIDRAYAEVKTDYIFHTEDDWEFIRSAFIEQSLQILEAHKDILQVWLREDSNHPIVQTEQWPFKTMQLGWREGWSGFCFNPGLRRLSDFLKIGSYGRHVGYDPRFVGELYLSRLYRDLGYSAAALTPAYVKHIGQMRHVQWMQSQPAKVLVAIPVCHAYSYGNYNNTFHNDRQTGRITAMRQTWLRDVAAFDSYVEYKFFYGKGGNRQPLEDEIFLDCDDNYESLPNKMQAVCRWALDHGFEYMYKCDDDTFCYIERLLASDFREHDQMGFSPCHLQREPSNANYITGGPGYTLNKRSMQLVSTEPISHRAEDLWVGRTLMKRRMNRHVDLRFMPGFGEHFIDIKKVREPNNLISMHSVRPDDMVALYNRTIGIRPELREANRPKSLTASA